MLNIPQWVIFLIGVMTEIALIACDHGFGHTKRCYIFGLELAKIDNKVTIFARRDAIEKFSSIYGTHENLTCSYLNTNTDPRKSFNQLIDWLNLLPDLSKYKLVVSDNLPEILYLRKDAILSGSFLWHLDSQFIDDQYRVFCEDLLMAYRPKHIASEFFVSVELSQRSQLIPIGLIGSQQSKKSFQSCFDGALLISGGKSAAFRSEFNALVNNLVLCENPKFTKVYVDSWLMPNNPPAWMFEGDFSPEMYNSISVAIIRPGVGTVTDCMANDVFIISMYESENKEMITNSKAIISANYGVEARYEELDEHFLRFSIIEQYSNFKEKRMQPSFNGERQFVKSIQNL